MSQICAWSKAMRRPKVAYGRLFMLLICCGISAALTTLAMTGERPSVPSEATLTPVEGSTVSANAAQEPREEQTVLKAGLQDATQALEALKKELLPRIAEAESTVQYVSTALEKALQPREIMHYEEELRLAEE